MPIVLVLDTNVLRQEGLASRNMQLLARLTASSDVALRVPEIVKREFLSQRLLEAREQFEKCDLALNEIGKQIGVVSVVHQRVVDAKARLSELRDSVSQAVQDSFDRWATDARAEVLAFNTADITSVLDDYFTGTGAFRRPKHRDDIPDAIASASIRPLLNNHDTVHIAVKDGAFKKHLQSESRYLIVDGLAEFLDLAEVKALLGKLDAQAKGVAALKEFLAANVFRARLSEYLRQAESMFEEIYLERDKLTGIERLDIDSYGHSLNCAQSGSISEIEYFNVDYIDGGHFSVGVRIVTRARIDYCADYGDYLGLSDERAKVVEEVSMDSDGISDLQEYRDVILFGHVELIFDPAFNAEALDAHSQYMAVPSPHIQAFLEVERAEVL